MDQYGTCWMKDYMRMDANATADTPNPLVLAEALAFARIHGVGLAARFLSDAGVALEVALELLLGKMPKG